MTTEEKQLLLKDLCARVPYRVKISIKSDYTEEMEDTELTPYHLDGLGYDAEYRYLRPYLRPMSSMTEEEKKEFDDFCVIDVFVWDGNAEIGYKNQANIMSDGIDWLLKHHFDFRGLIPMGLALEALEWMYKV